MNFIKNHLKLLIIILIIVVGLVILGIFMFKPTNPYANEGFKGFYYRVYSDGKWSKWCKNGEICGKKGKSITDIEFKMGDNLDGTILYNVYKNEDFTGMTSVEQKLLDTTSNIEAIVLTSSNDIFKKYNIYYRTYNSKYGWLAYSYGDQAIYGETGINGAKGLPIEQIQIIVIARDSKTEIDLESSNNASYDFNLEENSEEQTEVQETENIE